MQQYFVEVMKRDVDNLVLFGQDAHHIMHVMRMRVGEQVRIVINQEVAVRYEITQLDTKGQMVYLQKQDVDTEPRELSVAVTVVLGLLKSDKFDYAVQKLTELGVTTIIPWQAERSVVKTDAKNEAKKRNRWQTIAKEAAEQAQRLRIPLIETPQSLAQIMENRFVAERLYVADERLLGQEMQAPFRFVRTEAVKKMTFFIGPEGGISEKEIFLFEQFQQETDLSFISLGHRVLRAETAAIFAMSLVAGVSEALV